MALPSKRPAYLFVLPWSLDAIGGVNQVVTNLAFQMRDTGKFDPLVLIADWDAPDPVFEEIHGIRTVRWRVRPYTKGMGVKEILRYHLWEQRFRKKFARFCREQDIKAVNFHYPGPTAFTLERVLRSKGGHLPLLLSFHGTDVSNLTGLSVGEKSEWRSLIGRAHATVACSSNLAKRLKNALGTDLVCQVIYNGVDAEKFIEQGEAGPRSKENIILNVGKFDHNKGQDVLIEAFSRVAEEFPDTVLHLVGSKGERLSSLGILAMKSGLAERIQFFVDIPPEEMPSHFCRASIFSFPSRQEGFPLVLLEAGAFSLPVVASRVGGIPELIDDSVNGVLIDPDDPTALAHALRRLLSEPFTARQLGDRLHRRVSDSFSWIDALEQYEALLDKDRKRTLALHVPQDLLPTYAFGEVVSPRLAP